MRTAAVALAMVTLAAAAPLSAQSDGPTDRFSFDVAGGMNKFGPHAFGGLEMAMNRWLSLRAEALYSQREHQTLSGTHTTAASIGAVAALNRDGRFSPYILGAFASSASQGFALQHGAIAGAGLRMRFGSVQPFLEYRQQRLLSQPLSIGLRF
jgi:hypothetical protein